MDLCVVLALTFVTQSYSNPQYDRQPLGPEMCRRLCGTIVGCTHPVFHPTSLLCRVPDVTTMSSTNSGMSRREGQKEEELGVPEVAQCSTGSRMFYSRAGTLQCETPPSSTVPTVQPPQDKRRVIAVRAKTNFSAQSYQTALPSWRIVTYTLDLGYVTAVAYIPSSHRLLLSVSDGGKLLSFYLDSLSRLTIWENLLVRDIAVDGDKHEVFVVTAQESKRIVRMTVEGTPIKTFHFMEDLQLITVDPKRRMMYVGTSKGLFQCSYTGTKLKQFIQAVKITSLMFDRFQEVLYFNNNRHVIKLNPFSGKKDDPTSLKNAPLSIISIQNTLVLSTKDGLFVLYPNSSIARNIFDVGHNFKLCAVPCVKYMC